MRPALQALAAFALLVPFAFAQPVVYVSPLGDDVTGDGSVGLPFRTIDRAMLVVDPGGTVRVFAGDYPFAVTIGTSVTVEAWGGGRPVLGPRPSPGAIVTIAGMPDVTLRGLELLGTGGQLGVRVLGPSDRFVASDCVFRELGGDGVQFSGLQSADARIEDCAFSRIRDSGSPAAAVAASGTPRLSVTGCSISNSEFGVRLIGVPDAVITDCSFVDLAQSAVEAVAAPDLRVEDLRVTRCAHFDGPSAWASPADQFGAVSLSGLGHRALLRRVLVEDCGGYLGVDAMLAQYDGLFGVSIDGCDDVVVEDCALHRNEYGGLLVRGGSTGTIVRGTSFVANGSRNGPNEDVALHATVATVDAAECFWGLPGGPVFDGDGLGNGIAGGALVTLAPIAPRPALATATSMEFEASLPGGLRSRDVEIVDLDGDGRGDVVAAEDLSGHVAVHLRSGAGFAAPIRTWVGGTPVSLVAGLFDADALVDLAVVDEVGDRVVVLFGNGAGGFPGRSTVATPRRPLRIDSGEIDGAAGDDLVVACAGDAFLAGGVQLLLADGGGGFASSNLVGALAATDVTLVDLNSDGDPEVVGYDVDRAGAGLRTWPNLGGGSFGPVVVGPVDPSPILDATIVRVDLDGVGGRDLAVARFSLLGAPGHTTIDVYRNSGGGSLLGPARFDEVLGPAEMASGDVGDRGATRLCVALPATGEVRAYGPIEAQVPPYAPYTEVLFRRAYPQTVAVGELTDDGADDLLVADAATGELEIWRGRLATEVEVYGTGCAGERGVPRMLWRSVPELGSKTFAVAFEDGPTNGAAFLLMSILPAAFPVDGGCYLLVQPDPFAVSAASSPTGFGSVPLAVPVDRSLLRGELYGQWWLIDPLGSAYATLSSSPGIRIKVGG